MWSIVDKCTWRATLLHKMNNRSQRHFRHATRSLGGEARAWVRQQLFGIEQTQRVRLWLESRDGNPTVYAQSVLAKLQAQFVGMEEYEQEQERNRVVYYCEDRHGRIKIGCSSQLERRLSTHRSENGGIITLLAVEAGGMELEAARHAQFAEERLNQAPRQTSEWFRKSPRLAKLIKSLQK